MKGLKTVFAGLLAAALPLVATSAARAETTEVRFAQQFAFTYLQINVMKHQQLVEKHAAALGVPNVKVTFAQFSGGDAMNDALMSGAIDIVSGGIPAMLYLWDKTKGTPQEVRGVSALGFFELLLNTRNPNIKSIKDFKDTDKIAVPGVKVSGQAIILEMAAAKEWGMENWEKLDKLTVTISSPDQAAGMIANNPAFESSFAAPPFTELMITRNPSVRTILRSRDIVGDSTSAVWWTSKRFHDSNPKVYQAIINALKEAQAVVDKDLPTAVKYFIDDSGTKSTVDEIVTMLRKPGYGYHIAPQGFMVYADFLHQVGRLKNKPASWKDMFWQEIHDLNGS
jgi:NitT/TauT family transport system substrate-binding protein